MGKILYPGYFPNCETPSVSDNNLTLEQLMYLYWVVKKVDLVLEYKPDKDSPDSYDVTWTATKNAGTEEELVCGWEWVRTYNNWDNEGFNVFFGVLEAGFRKGGDSTFMDYLITQNNPYPDNPYCSSAGPVSIKLGPSVVLTQNSWTIKTPIRSDDISLKYWKATAFYSYGGTWDTQTGQRLK